MRAMAAWRRIGIAATAVTAMAASQGVAEPRADGGRSSNSPRQQDAQQYCGNIAASVESARIVRQQKQLSEMEAQLGARLAALEAKQNEVQALLDQLASFEQKTNDALVGFYSRMKPDAAAAQISQLDDDSAAALLLRLKAKVSSAILNEMEAARGAALARQIARQRPSTEGKRQ